MERGELLRFPQGMASAVVVCVCVLGKELLQVVDAWLSPVVVVNFQEAVQSPFPAAMLLVVGKVVR
jgi:hypothetical protein